MRAAASVVCLLLVLHTEAGGVIGRSSRGPAPLVYAPQLKINPARWMEDGYRTRSGTALRDICIPGTHDAGTYGINDIAENIAQTQEYSVYKQLMIGHRYLDLRIKKQDGVFRIHHGDKIGPKAHVILDDIKKFTEENPREVVIVHVQNVDSMSAEEQVELANDYITPTFGSRLAPRWMGLGATFQKFWDNGKRVLLIWGGSNYQELSPDFWYQGSTLRSRWSDTNKGSSLIEDQMKNVQNNRYGTFYASQVILTPRTADIILPPYFGSIEDMTDDKIDHATFTYELDRLSIEVNKRANIVMVDFGGYDGQYGVEACLDLNGVTTQYFSLKSVDNGLCADVKDWVTADGTEIIAWDCQGGDNQLWRFDYGTGLLHSKMDDSKCASVGGATGIAHLRLYPCADGAKKTAWDFHNDVLRKRSDKNFAIDLQYPGTAGLPILQFEYNGGDNQRWMRVFA